MNTTVASPAPGSRPATAPADGLSRPRRALAGVLLYFVVLGVGTVMLGPALPLLAARWRMPDASLGTLFLACFAGQFCGSWLATPRLRASMTLGAAAAAGGILALAFSGAATAHLALFCAGLGLGAGLTAGNVLVGTGADSTAAGVVANSRGAARSRNLALLNMSWGLGAIACPLLLGASLRIPCFHLFDSSHAEPGQVFFVGLAFAFASGAALLAWLLPRQQPPGATAETLGTHPLLETHSRIPARTLLHFGAAFMLYVGVENSLAGWLPTYAQRLAPGGSLDGRASAIALCFWICELASRGLTALLIGRVPERRFYRGCLLALIATAATLALTPRLGTAGIFAIAAAAALSLAPLYPLSVSFLLARTGNHPRVGKVFACASLGGTILPWLTGVLSTRFHSLRVGLATPAVGAALLLLLSFSLPRGKKPSQ
jgi:fucose permease